MSIPVLKLSGHDRIRKSNKPCEGCGIHIALCICPALKPLDLASRLSLVIHHAETRRTTNTGLLACKILTNSDYIVRGLIDQHVDLTKSINQQDYQPLLFYPSEDAHELTQDYLAQFSKPIHLLVPDGSWRQASKVHYRHKEISDVPRVFVSKTDFSKDQLRRESKENGMATLMAIAYAFGVLEGLPVQEEILRIFELKIKNTLKARSGDLRT